MAASAFWADGSPEAGTWDSALLGEDQLPGRVQIDVKKQRRIDQRKRKGVDAAPLKDLGYDPAMVKINVLLWREDQWVDWLEIFDRIDPANGGQRSPLRLVHPMAQLNKVDAVWIQEIITGQPDSVRGLTIEIHALEHVDAPPPTKTVEETTNGEAEPEGDPEQPDVQGNTLGA